MLTLFGILLYKRQRLDNLGRKWRKTHNIINFQDAPDSL